jgi:hypothetical protein
MSVRSTVPGEQLQNEGRGRTSVGSTSKRLRALARQEMNISAPAHYRMQGGRGGG